jgi:hypothetical protein
LPLVLVGGFSALLLFVYRPVLFQDRQFAWDNASYLYYPLYLRVQQEWGAGRIPLWDPGQNGGEPLLANPISAVLYPGKLIYAVMPYAWGARFYVVAHAVVALLGILALGRTLGLSWVASCLGAMSYAFGAPVLFLYCNVIFQVGAAWIPWGLRALDRLLRQGRPGAVAELAAVLALQVLGGDPQAAYVTAVCGAAYAPVLSDRLAERLVRIVTGPRLLAALGGWIVATVGLAYARLGASRFHVSSRVVIAAWAVVLILVAWRWRRTAIAGQVAPSFSRLTAACGLALALACVQILPSMELAGQSWRASGINPATLYRYSLDPWRLVELIWPSVFGLSSYENRSWIQVIPPAGSHQLWVPSLYVGGLTLALAVSGWAWKDTPPWCRWLVGVAIVSLLGSFGKYGGPLWWARCGPLAGTLGPQDPALTGPRGDGFPDDGAGSVYGLLALLLPGFSSFRYPSKLLPFTTVAVSVLAGAAWDALAAGGVASRRILRLGGIGLAVSLAGLVASLALAGRAVELLALRVPSGGAFGPTDIAGAWSETQRALAHGALMSVAVLLVVRSARRNHDRAGLLAFALMVFDLGAANARLIWTCPQAILDAPSRAAGLIEDAERTDPSPGPFRIHRMTGAFPLRLSIPGHVDPAGELMGWARGTLHPYFGLPLGIEYCATVGTLELDDHAAFYEPRMLPLPAELERRFGARAGQPVVYFPRRSFDLWGARYFLLPAAPDWASPARGIASFLDRVDLLYPPRDVLFGTGESQGKDPWVKREDWQLLRNRSAYPRAWVVHHARVRRPAADLFERLDRTESLLFMNDPIWRNPGRSVLDLRQSALVETNTGEALRGFLPGGQVASSESVAVSDYHPLRVELRAVLDRPGLVILADADYPGWRLTIDGRPAPIYRANRLMRAAALPAGEHTLVYTYEPTSFRVGAIISVCALIVLLLLAWRARRGPTAEDVEHGLRPA